MDDVCKIEKGRPSINARKKYTALMRKFMLVEIIKAAKGICEKKSRAIPNGINIITAGIIMTFVIQKQEGNCPK